MSTEQEVEAGMAWCDIAASAYKAYAAVTGGRNYAGLPMPPWDKLPPLIAAAWEAAVRQAGECLSRKPLTDVVGNEGRWGSWRPRGFVARLLVPVESSTIKAIGYDPGAERLYVAFRHGGVYQYWAVSPDTYAALAAAPSKGKHFAQHVKLLHTTRKLEPEEVGGSGHIDDTT